MKGDEHFEDPPVMYRQEVGKCGEILGIKYEVDFAVVYLDDLSFYIDFPVDVVITDMGGIELPEDELAMMKAQVLAQHIEELKRAPYYTVAWFGFRYIPNPMIDPDYDPTINPFEKWGLCG